MPPPVKPRRSALYMPASRAGALEKARTLAADVLIFDLEDAVGPDAKETARDRAVAAARSGAYGVREIVVRVNGLDTPWGRDDLEAAAASGADAVLVPKVEGPATLRQARALLRTAGAPERLALWAMVETPPGFLQAERIAAGGEGLTVLVMGTSDLAKDLNAAHTRDRLPFLTAFGLALLAAKAHGLGILDGVHLDLNDDEGFAYACRQGVELGFDGKTLIHPKQLAPCNGAFSPSAEAVAHARRVIAAHREAEASGQGVVLVDGRLVENLHVGMAERLVELADAIAARERAG